MRELIEQLEALNQSYYLGGDEAIDVDEYAARVSRLTGQLSQYVNAAERGSKCIGCLD